MRYNAKIIQCGNYVQLYIYENTKVKKDKNLCPADSLVKKIIINKKEDVIDKPKYREIRLDNALRSKITFQRLVKTNALIFLSFITLTFAKNITSIDEANKQLNIWRTRAKKIFPNLQYICVPEYQKRGAVHYHLITNIPINSVLVTRQKGKKKQYDVKYWNSGFSSVFEIKNINIVTYMSKYMTKDINNRLFGRKKYFYSKGLDIPKETFIDINDERVCKYATELLKDKKMIYHNTYFNKESNDKIDFFEFN
jgi:hypothetical protein